MTAVPRSRLRAADVLGVAVAGPRARPLRAVLTALGIAIAIATMVGVLGITAASRADLLRTLDTLGTGLLRVTPGSSAGARAVRLPPAAPAMLRRVPGVVGAAATTPVSATVRRNDRIPAAETGGIAVLAAETVLLDAVRGTVRAGSFLHAGVDGHPVTVLGSTAAARLGITDVTGRPAVHLGGAWFSVIGILDPLPLTPELDSAALISRAQAADRFNGRDDPGTVYVQVDPDRVDDVGPLLPPMANPERPAQVTVERPADALTARAAADDALTSLLFGLGGVGLLVGGIGVANVMIVAVLERRSEIGVRRALGATRGHIGLQFLLESVLLAGVGGMVGIGLGAAVAAGYAATRGWPVTLPLPALAGGITAAVCVGALAGLHPAVRAARLDPAVAVR